MLHSKPPNTHTHAHTQFITVTDTVVGVMVIGIEGPTALKCYGTAQEERKKSKFRPNKSRRHQEEPVRKGTNYSCTMSLHTHTRMHTHTRIF